jgi:hypothetical protein
MSGSGKNAEYPKYPDTSSAKTAEDCERLDAIFAIKVENWTILRYPRPGWTDVEYRNSIQFEKHSRTVAGAQFYASFSAQLTAEAAEATKAAKDT